MSPAKNPLTRTDIPLNLNEIAMILHALRVVQEHANGPADCMAGCCDHFMGFDELNDQEIDVLCERLNFGDQPDTPAPPTKPLGLQMADDIVGAFFPKTTITLSPAEVLAVDLMGKQAKAQLEKSDTEIAQSVLARPDLPVRRLTCCCCGESFQGRQFHNQDTGHGMGECCADRVLEHKPFGHIEMTLAEFERTYGVRGYHFDLPKGGD